jgi:hypothetical protein
MDPVKLQLISAIIPVGIAVVAGWVITTWMRVKNGYPLDGAWGQADQAAQPGKRPAAGRAWFDQGPARQCRTDRHRRRLWPDKPDRGAAPAA